MKLSPLDIKKQEFNRGFRGFEEQEVIAFLQMLADQWEDLLNESRTLESKVKDLENKLVHYQRVEDALQEALTTAKSSSQTKIANAEQEAALILREAQAKAEAIINKSKGSNQSLVQNNMLLEQRQQQVIARLRAFLSSEMDMLSSFEQQPLPDAPPAVELPESPKYEDSQISSSEPGFDSPVEEGFAESPAKPLIHNVEVDVDRYSDEIAADGSQWADDGGDFVAEPFYDDEVPAPNGSGESFSDADQQIDPADRTDRPPLRDNVSPADMDKIRRILDNLD